jgi:hypothetical protein
VEASDLLIRGEQDERVEALAEHPVGDVEQPTE